jgi:hypothetical protein
MVALCEARRRPLKAAELRASVPIKIGEAICREVEARYADTQ